MDNPGREDWPGGNNNFYQRRDAHYFFDRDKRRKLRNEIKRRFYLNSELFLLELRRHPFSATWHTDLFYFYKHRRSGRSGGAA